MSDVRWRVEVDGGITRIAKHKKPDFSFLKVEEKRRERRTRHDTA